MRESLTRWTLPAVALAMAVSTASAQVRQSADPVAKFNPITAEGYIEPPAHIKALVDPPARSTNFNYSANSVNPGSRRYLLRSHKEGMVPIAVLGNDRLNLAGWQIQPKANRARSISTASAYAYELYDRETAKMIKIEVPAGARVGQPSWSNDGKTFAFLMLTDTATHIYTADPATGKTKQFTPKSLLATNVTQYWWTNDGKSIIAVLIPDNRVEPKALATAPEPMVRVNENRTLQARTVLFLLETSHDQNMVEYYHTGQVSIIDVKNPKLVKKIGNPGAIRSMTASPDGMYYEVTYLDRPYSYRIQLSGFGTHQVLIDQTGKVIREMARRTMNEGRVDDDDSTATTPDTTGGANPPAVTTPARGAGGRGGAAAAQGRGAQGRGGRGAGADQPQGPPLRNTGKRNEAWNQWGTGRTFLQTEQPAAASARDTAALNRLADRIMVMPDLADTTKTTTIYTSPAGNTIQSFRWSDDGKILFVTESGRTTPGEVAVFLAENNARYVIVPGTAGGGGAAAAAPAAGGRGGAGGGGGGGGGRGGAAGGGGGGGGAFVMKTGSRGFPVVQLSSDGKSVYRQTTEQNVPSIEKIEIKTAAKAPVWKAPRQMTVVAPLDDDYAKVLVQYNESGQMNNNFILDTKSGASTKLTDNQTAQEGMRNVIRKTITAYRPDRNITLSMDIQLPGDWKPGTRLPAFMWFYPNEVESDSVVRAQALGRGGRGAGGGGGGGAGRGAGGGGGAGTAIAPAPPIMSPRSFQFLTQHGYAYVAPQSPIMGGDGLLPNDNYVRDLSENLKAIVDALVDSGFVDRNRVSLGGHSYGAFSTVNAMVNTTLFRAGIAGDGNYNRTLTPNGFQNERRTLWTGQPTYLAMSPFLRADKLHGALLMYHSMEDQNVGTDPINAPKLFHALQGLGKDVAMYMYPYEDHGPTAKETNLDQWARIVAWLDKYVKNAPAPGIR